MIQIEKTIVSLSIVTTKFVCNTDICKGACCVHGDSGAPLENEEALILEELFPKIKPFMCEKGIEAINQEGNVHRIDADGDLVTILVDNKECAFVVFENGIAKCSIEKAFDKKIISFRKPLSCHLYPVRVKKYRDFEAVNYDKWDICKPALKKGNEENIPLYVILKAPFERKYGKEWYKQLVYAAENLSII